MKKPEVVAGMEWNPPVELSESDALICKKYEKRRRLYRFLRLHRHRIFSSAFQAQLIAMYDDRPRGTIPIPPAMLAIAVLLQAYEQCSDEDVIDRLQYDARWQMILHWSDAKRAPFSQATLVHFRERMQEKGLYSLLLDRTLEVANEHPDIGRKQVTSLRLALDSQPLQGAAKVQDTINLFGQALRLLLWSLSSVLLMKPQTLIQAAQLSILSAPSVKSGLDLDWTDPDAEHVALTKLLEETSRLQEWIRTQAPKAFEQARLVEAKQQLDLVFEQDCELTNEGRLAIKTNVANNRQLSLFDRDMRHGRKSEHHKFNGYKKYVVMDLDSELILAATVLPANQPESKGADELQKRLGPVCQVEGLFVDRGFLQSQWVEAIKASGQVVCRGRRLTNQGRYTKHDFQIDLERKTVRCPIGQEQPIRRSLVMFPTQVCQACSHRTCCQASNTKTGRTIYIAPHEPFEQQLRAKTKTKEGRANLRKRTSIEHRLAHHSRRQGIRARYFGTEKNDWDVNRIAAIENLIVIDRKTKQFNELNSISMTA